MKQRQALVGILVLAAMGVWSYNGLLLTGHLLEPELPDNAWDTLTAGNLPALPTLNRAARTPYSGKFKDPFAPPSGRKTGPPKAKSGSPKGSARRSSPLPPRLLLQGILWDEMVPVAIVAGPDGRTETLHVGDTLAGVEITAIRRDAVLYRFGKQTFTLLSGKGGFEP